MNMGKIKLAFSALVLGGGGYLAGVTVTDDAGETVQAVASIEDMQRVIRDDAEAKRKAAQDRGDSEEQQARLIERRVAELMISIREDNKQRFPDAPGSDTGSEPDPDPTPDPDPDPDPDPTPGPEPEAQGVTVPGDAAVGFVSNIDLVERDGRHLVSVSGVLDDGWSLKVHLQDTTTWEQGPDFGVVAKDSHTHSGDGPVVVSLMIGAELVPGRRYRAEAWTEDADGNRVQTAKQTYTAAEAP